MKTVDVTLARVYLTEGEGRLKKILAVLHDEERVRGVTVFRGIAGFGKSGVMHSSTLLDLSLDLPLVVEFFDSPAKVRSILERLETMIEPGHAIAWPAQLMDDASDQADA